MATVIFKATEECNARCIYCDVVHKKSHGPKTMPLETLDLFFSRVNEFLMDRPGEKIEIIWHGGEPLLLGPAYFEHALRLQQKHCAETGGRIEHEIQSNLTLFSREFTDIFRKLGIGAIGTSYDPIENIRGLGLKRDSNAYNRKFMEAIRVVEQEGFGWSLIYVVTKPALAKPLEIFQFLVNLSPRGGFMFNPVLLYGDKLKHLKITAEEYADFLGTIFPVWWANREEIPDIRPFSYLTRNLFGEVKALMCGDSGQCAYSHINVLPDGTLSHCGRSGDWGLLNYGSIFEKSFSEVFADPQRDILLSRNTILPETDCRGCRFWNICHGGCPLDAWSASGSFLHKGDWCQAMKGFIEKYIEPTVKPANADVEPPEKPDGGLPTPASDGQNNRAGRDMVLKKGKRSGGPTWIDPIGGLGDTLMISGVLKQVSDTYPSRKFNLVARTKYLSLLKGHPAIARIGHPRPGANLMRTNYWDHEYYLRPGQRAYQILAHMFGLETPVEERLYVPGGFQDDPVLMKLIPWKQNNILICHGSESPRKQMRVEKWESLVERLNDRQIGVFQVGRMVERYVRGAYDLRGLTTPKQLISLIRHFDAIVTADNFVMHAAQLCAVPAVVLWGPTDHKVYGYAGQIHLQAKITCQYPGGCIGPGYGDQYATDCPEGTHHCTDTLDIETICDCIADLLQKNDARGR